jgi:phospholipase/lecithinase/hemolysin
VKRILLVSVLVFLAFMTSLVLATKRLEPINQMYIFGDSLSATGTLSQATIETYLLKQGYSQGRYSNGLVWIDYLASDLHLAASQINNFARGGATTGSEGNSLVPGLLTQVQLFVQTQRQTKPNALYVLWAGANDYLQGVSNATVPIENITQAISSLANNDASTLLVANLPDLGQLPATRNGAKSARLSALTTAHNQGLRRALKLLSQQYSQLQIVTLDANALYREASANPAAFGFSNVTSACLSGAGSCSKPDQFLFWDGIHPTSAAHRVIAERAFSILEAGKLTTSR